MYIRLCYCLCVHVCVSLSSVYLLHFDFAITCCSCCFCNGGAYPAANGSRRLQFSCFLFYYFLLPLHTRALTTIETGTHTCIHMHMYTHTRSNNRLRCRRALSMSASQLSLAAQTQLHENFISLVCFCFTFCVLLSSPSRPPLT